MYACGDLNNGTTLCGVGYSNFTIRRIRGGEVTTVAGTGEGGYADDDDLRAAKFFGLEGLAVAGGQLWVADGSRGEDEPYHRVRVVELD